MISAFRNHYDYHLQCIIVNDGNRDQTETTINDFARHHSELRRIKQKINHNKGNSVKTGIETADTKYIFFTGTDLAVPGLQSRRGSEYGSGHKSNLDKKQKNQYYYSGRLNSARFRATSLPTVKNLVPDYRNLRLSG